MHVAPHKSWKVRELVLWVPAFPTLILIQKERGWPVARMCGSDGLGLGLAWPFCSL